MLYSAVLIIPADLKPEADVVGAVMGWGVTSYTIPLGDGEQITHFGLRANVDAQFIRWIKGLDPLPDDHADLAAPVIAAMIADFSPDPTVAPDLELGEGADEEAPVILWGRAHLDAVLEAHGLIETLAPVRAP